LSHFRVLLVLILTLTIVGINPSMGPVLSPFPSVNAANFSMALNGRTSGWNFTTPPTNPLITVVQGDTVSIALKSLDVTHRFGVDLNNGGFDCASPDRCSNSFATTTPTTYPLVVDMALGDYTYYCSFHPPPFNMLGTLRVVQSRDIALSGLAVSRNFAYSGIIAQPIKVDVTASNQGSASDTFTVRAFANSMVIGSQSVTVAAGASRVVTINWNTTSAARGSYTISVQVAQLIGETDVSDNSLVMAKTFEVRKAGDVDGDSDVDIDDLIAVFLHQFTGSFPSVYDIDNDQDIDIDDLILTFTHQFT